jgi:hypothetical protein
MENIVENIKNIDNTYNNKDMNEPILDEKNERLTVFPIEYKDIWDLYRLISEHKDDYYKQKTGGVIQQICEKHLTISYKTLLEMPVENLFDTLDTTDANQLPAMVERLSKTYDWAYHHFVLNNAQ